MLLTTKLFRVILRNEDEGTLQRSLSYGLMVGVAQEVRAPGCGPGGRGFKPHHSPHLFFCGRGGIGRRARLRIWWGFLVGVQVPPPAPDSFFYSQTNLPSFCASFPSR